MGAKHLLCVTLAAWLIDGAAVSRAAQVANYIVGPQDVLAVAVWDQPNLSGKFTVDADGSFTFPLVGRVEVGGLTLRTIEELLTTRLADGFLRNPQVNVTVDQYRSQRIYVVGEVRNPGAYTLDGHMTLIEALARAGSATPAASGEAVIVRPQPGNHRDEPLLPDAAEAAEIIRVDIKDLQSGGLARNVALQDNDTIYLPRAELVYVFGQVRTPGAYPLQKGTTVLQALSLAGGVTDRGATGRIRIVRLEGAKKVDVKVRLNDAVQPGDTIVVPERFF
ncbi:MAG: SLBB domain-containing protein [Acidobacteria bacterium]|nr:SLBB domain-containing protein [Acidobacteriota bacterium]